MKSLVKIISRYMLSAVGIALTLLIVNLTVIVAWYIQLAILEPKDYRVSQVADGLTETSDGVYTLSETSGAMIDDGYQWAMQLDADGNVVWSKSLPDDVPLQYSVADVASFSRWYLNDYPVYVWHHLGGLFVVGGAKDSVWKHAIEFSQVAMNRIFPWIIGGLFVNVLLTVLITLMFGLRSYRSIKPLANGIKELSEKKAVHLSTKGIFGEFAESINKASIYLEKQETALCKRDNARSAWIEGVSHDIRTPLSIVMGYASEMENDSDLPQPRKEQAGIIRMQSEKIKTLVDDLNLASKLEYDMQPLREESVSLAELVRTAAADCLNSIKPNGYPIEVDIDESAKNTSVVADEQLLRRAISNLLSNSIKHNPDGCGIKIELNRENDQCLICVADDGIGFPDEMIEALNRAAPSQNLQIRGLGLNLVRQIMKVHGGSAEFRNCPEGGCEVILRLACMNDR